MRDVVLISSLLLASIAYAAEPSYPDQVIWGVYCGECVTNCSTMRKIDHSSLSVDTSETFIKSTPFRYQFSGKPVSDNEFKKFRWLLSEPVPLTINKPQSIFGQPDAYDQCGYYVAYVVAQNELKVLIDPHLVPDDLKELVRKLFYESL